MPAEAIAIAAPTGKAANRIAEGLAADGLATPCRARCTACSDSPRADRLHGGAFRHHENHPLPHAAVIVDEASMVDLALMEQLVRALRPADAPRPDRRRRPAPGGRRRQRAPRSRARSRSASPRATA